MFDIKTELQSQEHEWEVRLKQALHLGKSTSHSRIAETISLQETGGMYGKADRQTLKFAHTCKYSHARSQKPEGDLPRRGGRVRLRGGWVAYTTTDLSRSCPQRDSVIGSGHRRVCTCVSACKCLKSIDEPQPDRDVGKKSCL